MEAALPENETERLQTLLDYEILDTGPEQVFDDLTLLASQICGKPIALISLIDGHRQWFKSKVGLAANETSRDLAFCAHAILDEQLLVVPDATRDERFYDNELVTCDPEIRFYAGAPLRTPSGHQIGTICVIDRVPGSLTADQASALEALSRQVISQLELRSKIILLRQTNLEMQELKSQADRANEELAESNAQLEQFAYIASHDLRSPLRGIGKIASFIREDDGDKLSDSSKEYLKSLEERIKRMEILLDDLLAYSRLGKENAPTKEFDVRELLEEVVDLLQVPDGFEVSIQGDMPRLKTQPSPMQQVFLNLIGNAIKHHDQQNGSVQVSARDLGEQIEFTVADDGPGIDPRFHEQIFEIFRTLHRNENVEGSGIGLAIIHKIVQNAGGDVRVESSPGQGASFQFTWPKSQ